jgi:hypothetical protein
MTGRFLPCGFKCVTCGEYLNRLTVSTEIVTYACQDGSIDLNLLTGLYDKPP